MSSEKQDVVKIAPNARVIVAPTPFDIGQVPVRSSDARKAKESYLAWMGRYDVHVKGLDVLLNAYSRIPRDLRIPLRLHGRDSTDSRDTVRKLVRTMGVEDSVTVAGEIVGKQKQEFLRNAFLFVMPSRTESFSIALLEVLALGTPCLVAETMPIAGQLAQDNAAITTPVHEERLAEILCDVLSGERTLDSLSPRKYIEKNLSFSVVAEDFVAQVRSAAKDPTS